MIKCAITGHTGVLGSRLVKNLPFSFYLFKGDITNFKQVDKWVNKENLWGIYKNERINVPFYQPLINQIWKFNFQRVAGVAGFEPANADSKKRFLTEMRVKNAGLLGFIF